MNGERFSRSERAFLVFGAVVWVLVVSEWLYRVIVLGQ